MILSYLKTARRVIMRNKLFSFINIFGLARKTDIQFSLPDDDDFGNVGFDKQFQYKND